MKKIVMLAIVAVLSLGILTACGGGGATKDITVTMGEGGMKFSPATLDVAKGDNVKVTLVNKDAAQAHSFVVKELNAKSAQVQPSQTTTYTFKADKAGTFDFYCDVPGHKDGGMVGKITVK